MNRRGKAHGNGERANSQTGFRVQLLGPLTLWRNGLPQPLPASRKVRALFAYLALASRPIGRSQLCELLWDGPPDPRGELRWCLSRIRSAIDTADRPRVITEGDTIALDLADCAVDAAEVAHAVREGLESLAPDRKAGLLSMFAGDFLEGLELEGSPLFDQWLAAQRRHLRACHAALLEQLVSALPPTEAASYLEKWLQLSPFDPRAHQRLLGDLAVSGRLREGEEHVAATAALFEAEGLDASAVHEAWRVARAQSGQAQGTIRASEVGMSPADGETDAGTARRASIAVMPFDDESSPVAIRGGIADALAHDITTRLAKLRSMFVIAQGSTFALHERGIGPGEAGRMLNVDYVLAGTACMFGNRLRMTVELVEVRTARIVWSEVLNQSVDDAFAILDDIGNRVVASIASEIENIERNRAILRPPNSLDAWELHHRGLWHMYRFTREDNARARQFFESATGLDPTFSRAYAGLSFTLFQNAFQGWSNRVQAMEGAYAAAGQALLVDERDPAAHSAMGRAMWLRGDIDQAVAELERSVDLSPNFALGHYSLAFVHSQAGDPAAAISMVDCSRSLSPFDPMLYAMLGSRAVALARLGRHDEAADWASKAAARPNAHQHIFAIAACTLALAGKLDAARAHAAAARRLCPGYGLSDFLDAFRFEAAGQKLFSEAARRIGLA